ncbi:MAG TPA: aldose epimerase family protein, partial [Polyangiaceae bacterium]|nr:aldose epimerase family protein [Polyangiaceae bacterium]
SAAPFEDATSSGVVFSHVSPDGHAGYPGELAVEVRYRWDDQMCLTVEYSARTNRTTVVNLTQHSYFNLAGKGSILEHELSLNADTFTPTDARAIPNGELRPVEGSPFDFRTKKRIGRDIDARDEQLQMAGGYDHNWVVLGNPGAMRPAAVLECSATGRRLSVETTEPGIQFYSGNFMPKDGTIHRAGTTYGWREGLCLETQHFPDSPHRPEFPSTVLRPGDVYRTTTRFSFAVV